MISRCDECGSTSVVSIQVELSDDNQVEMQSCHKCGSKVWRDPQGKLTLRQVLDLASTHPPR